MTENTAKNTAENTADNTAQKYVENIENIANVLLLLFLLLLLLLLLVANIANVENIEKVVNVVNVLLLPLFLLLLFLLLHKVENDRPNWSRLWPIRDKNVCKILVWNLGQSWHDKIVYKLHKNLAENLCENDQRENYQNQQNGVAKFLSGLRPKGWRLLAKIHARIWPFTVQKISHKTVWEIAKWAWTLA